MLRKEFHFKELTIGLGAFALVFLCSWFISGCSPTSEKEIPLKKDASVFKTVAKEVAKEAPKKEEKKDLYEGDKADIKALIDSKSVLDFTGLKGVINGKWVKKTKSKTMMLEFTKKSIELTSIDWLDRRVNVGKYEIKSDLLHLTDDNGRNIIYGLEFLSDGELSIRPEDKNSINYFSDLSGHWQRVSLPIGELTSLEKGPIADAKKQVQKIEIKLNKAEGILESALSDRDELAGKLRSYGVNSAADLKDNIRGQRVADNLAKIAGEIDGLERQLASIESELLKAKTIVRRMEQEAAGISETEMRMLAQQLREVEDRTDGIRATPANAIDIDKAVEKALKAQGRPKKTK